MFRANNVIIGTSSSGSGPFTPVAAPTARGALDIYTAMAGQGFGTAHAVPVPLVLTEYTDATFTTPLQKMGFIGGVTLGANLAATSIAVMSVTWTQTGLNTSTPTYTISSPAAITVGTAANTLIEIDGTAELTAGASPFPNISDGDGWVTPIGALAGVLTTYTLISGLGMISAFLLGVPILAKRLAIRLTTGQVGGTGTLFFSLYARDSNGRAGKLLADYTGSSGVSLVQANNTYLSATVANPPLLTPGPYFMRVIASFTGQSVAPQIQAANNTLVGDGGFGVTGGAFAGGNYGGATGSAPDPSGITGITGLIPIMPYLKAS